QSAGSEGRCGKIPRQELRAAGLYALQLRGGRDHQAGGGSRQVARSQESVGADVLRPEVQDRDRRNLLRQEGRCEPPRLRGLPVAEEPAGKDHLHRDQITGATPRRAIEARLTAGFFLFLTRCVPTPETTRAANSSLR